MTRFRSILPYLVTAIVLAGAASAEDGLPYEFQKAESLYAETVARALSGGGSEAEKKRRVIEINRFYVKHLEELIETHRAEVSEDLVKLTARLDDMKQRLDESLDLDAVDARQTGGSKETAPQRFFPTVDFFRTPREGARFKPREDFELTGRIIDLPEGYVARIFNGLKSEGTYYPVGDVMTNGKFSYEGYAWSGWTGEVVYCILVMPEQTHADILQWQRDVAEWLSNGSPREMPPLLRGDVSVSLDKVDLEKVDCVFIKEWNCVFEPR